MKVQIIYLAAPYAANHQEFECKKYELDSANNLIIIFENDKKSIINDRHWAAVVEL